MTIPRTQTQESPTYTAQTQTWKWEKKHWLIVIAAACLILFFFGYQITEFKLSRTLIEWLPVIGTVAFAAEKIIKLTQ